VTGEGVEWVQGEGFGELGVGFGFAAEVEETDGAEGLCVEVVSVGSEAAGDVVEGLGPVLFSGIEFGEGVVGGAAPCCVPCGFVEGGVGFVEAALVTEGQA
jgi:hypothetical protein